MKVITNNASASVAGVKAQVKIKNENTFNEGGYENIPFEDRKAVKQLLEKLAQWGNADAAYELFDLYINGYFGEVEDRTSLEYLRQAANLGHSGALFVLGMYIISTPSTVELFNHAVKLFSESARRGFAHAEGVMSVMANDPKVAKHWRQKALKHGCSQKDIELFESVLFIPLLMFGCPSFKA